jgi:murein DD-endopeptidase MepM/ murein hydrolase activator NlpD
LFGIALLTLCINQPFAATVSQLWKPKTVNQMEINTIKLLAPYMKNADLSKYKVESAQVNSGETLSSLLNLYGFSPAEVLKAAKKAEQIYDVRQISVGQIYFIVLGIGQNRNEKYFIIEKSTDELVVFEFDTSPRTFILKKPLKKRKSTITCRIRSSLWATLKKQGASTDLISKLEEVFKQRIDLYRLKPDDYLSVIYEEYFDAGKSVKVGSILVAKLATIGAQVAAYRYNHCGTTGYFDEDGNSLENAFLPSPIENAIVASGYSVRRKHPVTNRYRKHPALDLAARAGTPVMSVGAGTITTLDYSEYAGNFIKISHAFSYASQYLHLSGFAEGVKTGTKVKKGEVIGFVGDTGLTTGPHLDFRFIKEGKMVDYRKIDLPDGQPIDIACLDNFKNYIHQFNLDVEEIS